MGFETKGVLLRVRFAVDTRGSEDGTAAERERRRRGGPGRNHGSSSRQWISNLASVCCGGRGRVQMRGLWLAGGRVLRPPRLWGRAAGRVLGFGGRGRSFLQHRSLRGIIKTRNPGLQASALYSAFTFMHSSITWLAPETPETGNLRAGCRLCRKRRLGGIDLGDHRVALRPSSGRPHDDSS